MEVWHRAMRVGSDVGLGCGGALGGEGVGQKLATGTHQEMEAEMLAADRERKIGGEAENNVGLEELRDGRSLR